MIAIEGSEQAARKNAELSVDVSSEVRLPDCGR